MLRLEGVHHGRNARGGRSLFITKSVCPNRSALGMSQSLALRGAPRTVSGWRRELSMLWKKAVCACNRSLMTAGPTLSPRFPSNESFQPRPCQSLQQLFLCDAAPVTEAHCQQEAKRVQCKTCRAKSIVQPPKLKSRTRHSLHEVTLSRRPVGSSGACQPCFHTQMLHRASRNSGLGHTQSSHLPAS